MALEDFIQLLSQASQNVNEVKQLEVLVTKEPPVNNESITAEQPVTQATENKEPVVTQPIETNESQPVITEPVQNPVEEPKTNTKTSNQFNGKIIITEIEQFVKQANSVLETIEVFLIPLEQIFVYAFETKNTIFVEEKKVITSFDNLVSEVKTAGAKGNFVFSLKQVTEEFINLLRKIFHL
jgi:hypothetical protein